MSSWNRKLNRLFEENAQLRKDYLKLKPTWKSEIGNKEILKWSFMKPIENWNLTDWSSTTRINTETRLKEQKTLIYVENWK